MSLARRSGRLIEYTKPIERVPGTVHCITNNEIEVRGKCGCSALWADMCIYFFYLCYRSNSSRIAIGLQTPFPVTNSNDDRNF